jgi:hypothetical protein
MDDVLLRSGKVIIETNNFIADVQETFAEMGTDESGSAGNEYAFHSKNDFC